MPMITAIAALSSELSGIRRHLRRTGSLIKQATATNPGDNIRLEEGRLEGRDCLLVQSGMGRGRAERALAYVLGQYRPAAVLSLGFCGALDASLRVGDLVLCSPISALSVLPTTPLHPVPLEGEVTCDPSLVEQALGVFPAPATGGCLTLPGVASDPALKEWLSSTYHHTVVDMESFWLGRQAEEAGVPFLAVRSVSDSRGESLPPLDDVVDDLGHVNLPAMSRYLLGHPQGIAEFARLARQARQAEKSLTSFTLQFLMSVRGS
jgi:adenosylhomocysteine nucleosidase